MNETKAPARCESCAHSELHRISLSAKVWHFDTCRHPSGMKRMNDGCLWFVKKPR